MDFHLAAEQLFASETLPPDHDIDTLLAYVIFKSKCRDIFPRLIPFVDLLIASNFRWNEAIDRYGRLQHVCIQPVQKHSDVSWVRRRPSRCLKLPASYASKSRRLICKSTPVSTVAVPINKSASRLALRTEGGVSPVFSCTPRPGSASRATGSASSAEKTPVNSAAPRPSSVNDFRNDSPFYAIQSGSFSLVNLRSTPRKMVRWVSSSAVALCV